MSAFSAFAVTANAALLRAFGETITYQRRPPLGEPTEITAIPETLPDDQVAPSVHAAWFLLVSDLESTPEKGDRVTDGDTIYTVIAVRDAEGGAVRVYGEKVIW